MVGVRVKVKLRRVHRNCLVLLKLTFKGRGSVSIIGSDFILLHRTYDVCKYFTLKDVFDLLLVFCSAFCLNTCKVG